MEENRGLFIVFEGIDLTGKTTAVQTMLQEFLRTPGVGVKSTREPGGSLIAEEIRKTLLQNKACGSETMLAETEALLVYAARNQHLHHIRKSLKNQVHVLCDRFNDSTWAYQHYAGKCNVELLMELEDQIIRDTVPDVVILLDAEPSRVAHRAANRDDNNAFDEQSWEYKQALRKGFLTRALRKTKTCYFIIDATQDMETVQTIVRHLSKYILNYVHQCHLMRMEDGVLYDGPTRVSLCGDGITFEK